MTDSRAPEPGPADRTHAGNPGNTGSTGHTGSTGSGTSRTSVRAGTTRAKGQPSGRPRAVTVAGLVDGLVLAVLLGAVVVGFGPVWGTAGYLLIRASLSGQDLHSLFG